MKETRILKISLGKSGSGSLNPKLGLPSTWIKEMGINEKNREVEVTFKDSKITIQKKSLD
jgi:hypothetical protein